MTFEGPASSSRSDRSQASLGQSWTERRAGVVMVTASLLLRATSMDVAEWLRGLELDQYASAFRANDIDAQVLRRLTAEDLRELGVGSVGHRRRLLDAIAALSDGPPAAEATPAAAAASTEAELRQLTIM